VGDLAVLDMAAGIEREGSGSVGPRSGSTDSSVLRPFAT
jgi:hypothetical protein